jgi:thiol-disulfide isomerase/thioredoxin
MRIIRAFLYTGFLACANMSSAGTVDPALVTGEMAKLIVVEPKALPTVGLVDLADQAAGLETYKGRWLVLNLWATWCVPCREEMPALDKLALENPDMAVVAVATGPNPVPAIKSFLDKAGVKSLTVLRDPAQELAHQMGVLGLPVTVIVNPDGMEVARLIGGADWSSAEAKAVFAALAQ